MPGRCRSPATAVAGPRVGTLLAVRVLVVRHHEEDAPGFVGEAFAARGATVETLVFPAGGDLPGPGDVDHVVFLGATSSVYNTTPWIEAELDWLRHAPAPVMGICFGAHLLAAARTGAVERSPIYELGWVPVDPVDPGDPEEGGHDTGLAIQAGPWFEFHGDRCVLPPAAKLLATNHAGVQAFTIGRDLGVQFHPELDAAQLERWLEHGARELAVRKGVDPDEMLARTVREEPQAKRRAATLVDAYLAHVARHDAAAAPEGDVGAVRHP